MKTSHVTVSTPGLRHSLPPSRDFPHILHQKGMPMLRFEVDSKGRYLVRWPSTDDKTLQLGTAFVAYEQTLPAAQQSPLLDQLRSTLASASSSAGAATSGETTRAVSAETLRQARADAKVPLNQAFDALKLAYSDNLALLEAYGLKTLQDTQQVRVYKPKNQTEWDNFLIAYVETQRALEPSAQLQKPALSTLEPLAETVSAARKTRDEGRTQREMGVSSRVSVATRLHDLLELAAATLVITRFDFQVTRELGLWGYEVVEARASNGAVTGAVTGTLPAEAAATPL